MFRRKYKIRLKQLQYYLFYWSVSSRVPKAWRFSRCSVYSEFWFVYDKICHLNLVWNGLLVCPRFRFTHFGHSRAWIPLFSYLSLSPSFYKPNRIISFVVSTQTGVFKQSGYKFRFYANIRKRYPFFLFSI
jgi:hypothetical protein